MAPGDLESLRTQWSTLYTQTLPNLARAKNPAQAKWPVTLDHCFARIILDNTVGRGVIQWDNVIKKPAVKNMDESQLNDAIELGEKIRSGSADLVDLDRISLMARGKGEKKYKNTVKRGREVENQAADDHALKAKKTKRDDKQQSTLAFVRPANNKDNASLSPSSPAPPQQQNARSDSKIKVSKSQFPNPNTAEFLKKIQNHASLTPFRKRLYSTLLSVPPGHYTTYQAMAIYLDSCARAIGSGMRNNPYAPDVPCHRVLASDGSIGGFHGSWGEEGKYAGDKRNLLRSEGVYFDSKGRGKGPVFRDFQDLSKV